MERDYQWQHDRDRYRRAEELEPRPEPDERDESRRVRSCKSKRRTRSEREGGGYQPPRSPRPDTGFEGMSHARDVFSPVTSVFVSGRRPRTCKDL